MTIWTVSFLTNLIEIKWHVLQPLLLLSFKGIYAIFGLKRKLTTFGT